jgi:hypothetical protein
MKSKLLQKISNGINQAREVVDGKKENIGDSPLPWGGMRPHPIPSIRRLTPRPSRTFLHC